MSVTQQGLEPRPRGSGPLLFPTAYAASQWTEHLQWAELSVLASFLGKACLGSVSIALACHCSHSAEWPCLNPHARPNTLSPSPNTLVALLINAWNSHLKVLRADSKLTFYWENNRIGGTQGHQHQPPHPLPGMPTCTGVLSGTLSYWGARTGLCAAPVAIWYSYNLEDNDRVEGKFYFILLKKIKAQWIIFVHYSLITFSCDSGRTVGLPESVGFFTKLGFNNPATCLKNSLYWNKHIRNSIIFYICNIYEVQRLPASQ